MIKTSNTITTPLVIESFLAVAHIHRQGQKGLGWLGAYHVAC